MVSQSLVVLGEGRWWGTGISVGDEATMSGTDEAGLIGEADAGGGKFCSMIGFVGTVSATLQRKGG